MIAFPLSHTQTLTHWAITCTAGVPAFVSALLNPLVKGLEHVESSPSTEACPPGWVPPPMHALRLVARLVRLSGCGCGACCSAMGPDGPTGDSARGLLPPETWNAVVEGLVAVLHCARAVVVLGRGHFTQRGRPQGVKRGRDEDVVEVDREAPPDWVQDCICQTLDLMSEVAVWMDR
jgi:hypothetical protein